MTARHPCLPKGGSPKLKDRLMEKKDIGIAPRNETPPKSPQKLGGSALSKRNQSFPFWEAQSVHPGRLTWKLKMMVWFRWFSGFQGRVILRFQPFIFRGVNKSKFSDVKIFQVKKSIPKKPSPQITSHWGWVVGWQTPRDHWWSLRWWDHKSLTWGTTEPWLVT